MRRSLTVALAGALVAAAVSTAAVASGTAARFVDTDPGAPGVAGTATVVLGARTTPVTLTFGGVRAGTPRTVSLVVVYRGTVPATIQLRLPSGATPTSCLSGPWRDAALVGGLTLTAGTQPSVSFCSLLDGVARTLVATVQPGSTTTVPITVAVTGLAVLGRTERAAVAVRAVGGFSDQVLGTLSITTSAVLGGQAVALSAPAPQAVPTPAPGLPAACPGTYAETVVLTPDRPRFVAAEDRPGGRGPYRVLGTPGDDTVVGSGAGDCLSGGGGADALDGGAGDDVLLGDAGLDRLTGGPGADALDGGADLADCDADPADRTTGCRPAPIDPAAVEVRPGPATTAPAPTTATAPAPPPPAPTTTTDPPTSIAPDPTTDPVLPSATQEN